jgi:hypothetical protein
VPSAGTYVLVGQQILWTAPSTVTTIVECYTANQAGTPLPYGAYSMTTVPAGGQNYVTVPLNGYFTTTGYTQIKVAAGITAMAQVLPRVSARSRRRRRTNLRRILVQGVAQPSRPLESGILMSLRGRDLTPGALFPRGQASIKRENAAAPIGRLSSR